MRGKIGRIAIIGSGNMGTAIIAGMLRKKLVSRSQIVASGPRKERGTKVRADYGVRVTTSNTEAVRGADVVVLAVKPQSLAAVASELAGKIPAKALVLSVLAGRTIEELSQKLAHGSIVRAMPNTPAQIGEGVTVWTASATVRVPQRQQAALILGACGDELLVEAESYLDMATALSANGPAYVFLFLEALIDAGVHLGFPRYIAERLVMQTVSGSMEYVKRSPRHLSGLRNEVTSPGGTSAEALYYLEKAGFRTAVARAVWAGYERSVELGRGKPRLRLSREGDG